jgi:hypothetical protein
MTKDEALDLALEALELSSVTVDSFGVQRKTQEAIIAIKQARALDKKAENARELGLDYEPVAQYSDIVSDGGFDPRNKFDATPPAAQRQWVGLTDDEFENIELGCRSTPFGKIEAMRKVETKLKEKNT